MITEKTVIQYTCSDGQTFTDALDAEIHEAECDIEEACQKHGYSEMSTQVMADILTEHVDDFAEPLRRLANARSAKRARLAAGGQGSQAAAHNAGPIKAGK